MLQINKAPQAPWHRLDDDATGAHVAESPTKKKASYFEMSLGSVIARRLPWLLALMLVQSISGWVVDRFAKLVEKHVVLASFLTMLVGGGGNSSGQTVAELVAVLARGEVQSPRHLCRVLLRELAVGMVMGLALGLVAYPRVLLLSSSASELDAIAISLSYAVIVMMANAIGVVVAMVLHLCDMAPVGAPPVVQVVVDVLGVTITMLIAQAILGESEPKESDA